MLKNLSLNKMPPEQLLSADGASDSISEQNKRTLLIHKALQPWKEEQQQKTPDAVTEQDQGWSQA